MRTGIYYEIYVERDHHVTVYDGYGEALKRLRELRQHFPGCKVQMVKVTRVHIDK